MIAGIGVDLATVSRIAKVHRRYGKRFANRILNELELPQYETHGAQDRYLTKRFAVKEAAVKALGTGERQGVLLKDFYVLNDELGKPQLNVSGQGLVRCTSLGITEFHVSLSDEGDTVVAFVVLERQPTPL
ncbi:MAG: holo-ACP synthase [Granulosicoccus sp.]|nr:holo-ACP synthase [Granulosicoccus sp.]